MIWSSSSIPALVATTVAALVLSGGPQAQAAPSRAASQKALPDWSGVWLIDEPAITTYGYDVTAPGKMSPPPPLLPEYDAIYKRRLAAQQAGKPELDSGALCLPNGMPRMMRDRYLIEFVPKPGVVYTLHEYQSQMRRIYTDGRKHPDDVDPSFAGHSIGHWEGEVLVVDTVGVKPGWYDQGGLPHSDAVRVTERIRRLDAETMEDIITVEDPKVFARPWKVTKRYKRKPDWEVSEYVCAENNRNPVGADGRVGTVLGTPPSSP